MGHTLTILEDSILVAGHTFQVNLTPSLSSFWAIKSPQVDILDLANRILHLIND